MSFSPGYNDGNEGPLGTVGIEEVAVSYTYLLEPSLDVYGLVKFKFIDPEGEGLNLQDYTGGLGWRFDIGNNTPTNVFGYPNSGDLMNCLKNFANDKAIRRKQYSN
ncbi:serine protease [Gigaspora margarita]|uniref:Serine protease n=1 Tax=Gigaspora margarita TaxID=4874 RepID=A0A8H4AN19_GIGMA|nr:serine protease [Gigaspora margarita]